MTMKIRRVIVSTLSFVLTASPVAAQTVATSSPVPQPVLTTTGTTTSGTTTTGTTTAGSTVTGATDTTTLSAYESLSIGNRKIARALFEAQKTETPPTGTGTGTTTGTTSTSKNLTLDQIAGLKQSGQGWGQVFKSMQSRGLVTEKNLGQVVSQYGKQHSASRAETTTASNRTDASDATTASAEGKADRSSVGKGHGHAKQPGTTVSARGSDFRGHGGGNSGGASGGGGNGNGHGKNK
jgi:hypothetical protein